jgi:hypothetical protein
MDELMRKAMEKHKIVRYQQSFIDVMTTYKLLLEAKSKQLNNPDVSGKRPDYKSIRAAAVNHMETSCTNPSYDHNMKKYCVDDFIAGAQWVCANGGEAQGVSADNPVNCIKCGKSFRTATALWSHFDRCA